MKNLIQNFAALLLIVMTLQNANAQSYKPIEVDLGVRYNILTGDYTGGGIGLFLEPHYNVNDKISIGLRLGFDILGGTLKEGKIETSSSLLSSFILTGDYMLVSSGNKRVFAGLGLGLSSQGSIDIGTGGPDGEIGTVFGIVPRVGVKLGVLKLALDYSIYAKEGAKKFLGINLGLSFGGRKIK